MTQHLMGEVRLKMFYYIKPDVSKGQAFLFQRKIPKVKKTTFIYSMSDRDQL